MQGLDRQGTVCDYIGSFDPNTQFSCVAASRKWLVATTTAYVCERCVAVGVSASWNVVMRLHGSW